MKNIVLWLDDLRDPSEPQWAEYIEKRFKDIEKVVWVKNYSEFASFIDNGPMPRFISFDHDLGIDSDGVERNGYDCAKHLVDTLMLFKSSAIPDCDVHSANPVGAENILKLIENYKYFIKCD